MRKIIIFYTLILISGCYKLRREPDRGLSTRDDFLKTLILKADTVILPDLKNPGSYLVIKDNILLVHNLSAPDLFIEIYNLNSNKLLCITGKTGRGPGEFLIVDIYYNNGEDYF